MSRNYTEFFSWFETVYTDENIKPENTLNEIYGQSSDINSGFGGKFVWLRVHRAPKPSMIANKIWVTVSQSSEPGRDDDLARGAGGHYRYLDWSNDAHAGWYITDIGLWRPADRHETPPPGWQNISGDINSGRGGDYLYVVWNVKEYVGRRSP